MKKDEFRVLVKNNGLLYYLLKFIIGDDGSVYISLVNKKLSKKTAIYDNIEKAIIYKNMEQPEVNTKNISYHPTGQVNYHNAEHESIFCEPISEITKVNTFLMYLMPSITKLDLFTEKTAEHDFIWKLPEERKYCFAIALCPDNFFSNAHNVAFRYQKRFALIIEECISSPQIPLELSQELVTIAPTSGLFNSLQMSEPQALIHFEQWKNGTSQLIIYPPNGEGVYKVITCVPMCMAPKLNVIFADPKLYFEQIDEIERRNTAVVRFRVKHKKTGYVNRPVNIIGITLDSRLGG